MNKTGHGRKRRILFLTLWLLASLPVLVWLFPEQIWTRISLAEHGLLFARVVPKEKVNVFEYFQTDNMALRSIVYSKGKPVGYIMWPWSWIPEYEPLGENGGYSSPPANYDPFKHLDLIVFCNVCNKIGKLNAVLLASAAILGLTRRLRKTIGNMAT